MSAADFKTAFARSSLPQWEEGAVQCELGRDTVLWPMIAVPLSIPSSLGGHTASVLVSSDVFAIGSGPGDYFRLPLTPVTAQRIANLRDSLLPTRKIADDIFKASTVRLPRLFQSNRGPNFAQYVDYDGKLAQQFTPSGQLTSGHKKDVVIWRGLRPGKVAIYGWYAPDGTHIQGLSDIHYAGYVDYSHGIRFVQNDMILDGKPAKLENVLRDSKLWALVSDEGGPFTSVRYPVPKGIAGSTPASSSGQGPLASLDPAVIKAMAVYPRGVLAGQWGWAK